MFQIGPPENETKKAIPVAILKHTPEKTLHALTRLQNLVFIIQTGDLIGEQPLSEEQSFTFVPHNYGPYSEELMDWMEQLDRNNMITMETNISPAGNTIHVYHWTDSASEIIDNSAFQPGTDMEERVEKALNQYGSTPILELLDEVNMNHPDYLATR